MNKIGRILLVSIMILGLIPCSKALEPVWFYDIGSIMAVSLSPNGEYVAIGTENGEIYLLNKFGELLHFRSILGRINCIDIADNANVIVGTQEKLSFYNPLSNRVFIEFDRDDVISCDISTDGKNAAVGTVDSVFLLDEEGLRKHIQYNRKMENIFLASEGIDYVFSSENSIGFGFEKPIKLDSQITGIAKFEEYVACGTRGGLLYLFNEAGEEKWKEDIGSQINSVDMINQHIALAADGVYLFDFVKKELKNLLLEETPIDIKISKDFITLISDRLLLSNFDGDILWYYEVEDLRSIELSRKGKAQVIVSIVRIFYFNLNDHDLSYTFFYPYPSRKTTNFDLFLTKMEISSLNLRKVLVGDINGEGENEIVGISDEMLVAWNSKGLELWSRLVDKKCYLYLLDVDNDMISEIITSYQEDEKLKMRFFDGTNSLLKEIAIDLQLDIFKGRKKEFDSASIHPISAIDIDNDNEIELICILSSSYSLKPRGILLLEYSTGKLEWYYSVAPHISRAAISDIDNDGIQEIIIGTVAPCNGNEEGETDDCHSYVIAIDEKGNELWIKDFGLGFIRTYISVDDIDNDDLKEIIVTAYAAEGYWGRLVVLDSNGNPITGKDLEFEYAAWWNSIADFDDDGYKEIITGNSDDMIRIFDSNLNLLEERYVMGVQRNSIINDIDGDGAKEIIIWTDRGDIVVFNHNFKELWRGNFDSLTNVVIVSMSECTNDLLIPADKLYLYSFIDESQKCSLTTDILQLRLQKRTELYENIAENAYIAGNLSLSSEYYSRAFELYEIMGKEKEKDRILESFPMETDQPFSAYTLYVIGKNFLEKEDCSTAKEYLQMASEMYMGLRDAQKVVEIHLLLERCSFCEEALRIQTEANSLKSEAGRLMDDAGKKKQRFEIWEARRSIELAIETSRRTIANYEEALKLFEDNEFEKSAEQTVSYLNSAQELQTTAEAEKKNLIVLCSVISLVIFLIFIYWLYCFTKSYRSFFDKLKEGGLTNAPQVVLDELNKMKRKKIHFVLGIFFSGCIYVIIGSEQINPILYFLTLIPLLYFLLYGGRRESLEKKVKKERKISVETDIISKIHRLDDRGSRRRGIYIKSKDLSRFPEGFFQVKIGNKLYKAKITKKSYINTLRDGPNKKNISIKDWMDMNSIKDEDSILIKVLREHQMYSLEKYVVKNQ